MVCSCPLPLAGEGGAQRVSDGRVRVLEDYATGRVKTQLSSVETAG